MVALLICFVQSPLMVMLGIRFGFRPTFVFLLQYFGV